MTDLSRADALNRQLGISGRAKVMSGNGGLPKLEVTTKSATAEIYLHGAQVTSWQPAGAEEVIFLSGYSQWEDGRAIRGGIPVCFPWFRAKAADPEAPAHGFVRTREWQLESVIAEEDGSVIAVFSTESDSSTRRWWPNEFRLALRIEIGSKRRCIPISVWATPRGCAYAASTVSATSTTSIKIAKRLSPAT
jgi:glucose-6-phosphate 1-epimerase